MSSSEMIEINTSSSSESNSTCFEAVSAKNSKLSASEQSSKGPNMERPGGLKKTGLKL